MAKSYSDVHEILDILFSDDIEKRLRDNNDSEAELVDDNIDEDDEAVVDSEWEYEGEDIPNTPPSINHANSKAINNVGEASVVDFSCETSSELNVFSSDKTDENPYEAKNRELILDIGGEVTSTTSDNNLSETSSTLTLNTGEIGETLCIVDKTTLNNAENSKYGNLQLIDPLVANDDFNTSCKDDYFGNVSRESSSSSDSDADYRLPAKFTRGKRGGRVRTRGGRLWSNVLPTIQVRKPTNSRCTGRGRPVKRNSRGGPVVNRSSNRNEGNSSAPQYISDMWEWGKVDIGETINFEDFPFTGGNKLNSRIRDDATPMEYLDLYMTDEIINIIVTETNRYAAQFMDAHAQENISSYVKKWVPVTINDIKQFIGILVLMGIIYKPTIHMYWSINELLSTPIFLQIMARDRFYLILKFFHFNNNQDPDYDPNSPSRDKLHKIRPFLELIRDRCRKVYSPGQYLSVDESLVLYKGRLKFKQYIKTKRARFGIKLYELTTSDGITLDFLVYCGQGMFNDEDPNSDMPSTERIPSVLMAPYLGKGHTLYTDNYYTSPSLATYFLSNKTHLCGTVRPNRRFYSKDIRNEQLEKGEAVFYKRLDGHPMVACKYRALKDKANKQAKVVYMLSTAHQAIMGHTGKVTQDGTAIVKPKVVQSYNAHMGGVDRVDQQLHSIKVLRRAYKWYRKLALRLIMQVFLNAHKVFQIHSGNSEITFLDFVIDGVTQLVTSKPIFDRPGLLANDDVTRLTGRHFAEVKKPKEGAKDKNPSKMCRVCSARGIRTDKGKYLKTVYICPSCPSEPGLHPGECFKVYHTILDYSKV